MRPCLLLLIALLSTVSVYTQGIALFAVEKNGKAGFIDQKGKLVVPYRFDEVREFSEGLAGVRVGDDWGYIDVSGRTVITPQFFETSPFSEGLASVGVYFPKKRVIDSKVGYYCYIDRTGRLITTEQFGVAFDFSEGLAQVLTDDYKHVFIDRTGRHVLEFDAYENQFRDGLALFKTVGNMPESRVGYIDGKGRVVIRPTYLDGESFSEGLACVRTENGAGFIDTDGRTVIDFQFDACESFAGGLAAVSVDGQYGYIDKTGKFVISPKFAEAQYFLDGLAIVRIVAGQEAAGSRVKVGDKIVAVKEGLFGAIDKAGQFVISPKYTQIYGFKNGLAWVNLSSEFVVHGDVSRWGYINKKGELVWKSF